MNYGKLYTEFKMAVPESIGFCKEKEEENFIDDTVGIHVSFGMIIVPYILYIVDNKQDTVIQKIFCFMEQMAICQDTKVQEVLDFTILEQLVDEGHDKLQECKKYMGMNTLQHCEKIEEYFY
jgi:hypothetical protein